MSSTTQDFLFSDTVGSGDGDEEEFLPATGTTCKYNVVVCSLLFSLFLCLVIWVGFVCWVFNLLAFSGRGNCDSAEYISWYRLFTVLSQLGEELLLLGFCFRGHGELGVLALYSFLFIYFLLFINENILWWIAHSIHAFYILNFAFLTTIMIMLCVLQF